MEISVEVFETRTPEGMGWDNAIKNVQPVRERIEEDNLSTIETLRKGSLCKEHNDKENYKTVSETTRTGSL